MLTNPNMECQVYDISKRTEVEELDFDSLIPESDELTDAELEAVAAAEKKQKAGQGTDAMPMEIFNGLLKYFLNKKDFRSVLWIVLQANTGLRYVDISCFRKIDLLNEHNKFRESILETERKTGKKRTNFINDAIKMAALMYLWDNPHIKPLDYLITPLKNARRKGYITDENGNKIVKPLSRQQASLVMRNALVDGLKVAIKNDSRTKESGDAYLKLATHSLRKAYSAAVINQYVNMFDSDLAYAHAAAAEQLQYDLNHSSRAMTYHYIGDYVETKRKINMAMNLGIEVLRSYFEEEKRKYLSN